MSVWGMLRCAVRRAGGDGCARGVVRAVCGALGLIYKEFVIVFDSAPLRSSLIVGWDLDDALDSSC